MTRGSHAILAALMLITAAAMPRVVHGSPALFTSDQKYFASQDTVNRVVYETLGEAGLESIVRGVLGMDDPFAAAIDSASAAASSRLPEWINAEELARAPPEVVLVYQGAQPAGGSDLAAPGVAQAVKKVTAVGAGGGSSVTAPHAGLFGADAATYSPTKLNGDEVSRPISTRLISALGDAERGGATKSSGGRRFIAGACDPLGVEQTSAGSNGDQSTSTTVWLKEGEEIADFMRHRSSGAAAGVANPADVVVICAPTSAAAVSMAMNENADDAQRLAYLEAEVGSFASFVEALRENGVRHAAVYAGNGARGNNNNKVFDEREKAMDACVGDVAAKAAGVEGGVNMMGEGRGGRALLFSGAKSPPPAAAAETYVCDDLCKLQTNVVSGLIFFWTVVIIILFGYALMHNLDCPSKFEKSKEETDR